MAFEPFDAAMVGAAAPACGAAPKAQRGRVTVATGGNLYPCAPMVGEDRDDGAEAALRLGHLGDGPEAACAAVAAKGTGCGAGKGCACAAYLETGDATTPGEQQRWFGRVCRDVAAAIAAGLAQAEARRAAGDDIAAPPAKEPNRRRKALVGLALGAGGLAVAGVGLVQISRLGMTQGKLAHPPAPEPHTAPAPDAPPPFDPELMPPGQMALPAPPPEPPPNPPAGGIGPPPLPPEPPPPPAVENKTDGEMIMEGDIGAP